MLKELFIFIFCHPLAVIINKSFEVGKVLKKMKIAKIVLFLKTGDTNDLNYWYPISILI